MEDARLTRGILGIANLGNTCFMNAALQALRHCPEWTVFCSQEKVNEHIQDVTKPCSIMLLAYQDLLKSIWGSSGPGYVKPFDFYTKLRTVVKGTIYEEFTHRTPQDAHEFLVWLLDQMYMATQKEVDMQIRNEKALHPMILNAVKGWKGAFEKQYSPLTDLVFGMYRIQYKCTGCSTTHNRWETFNTLKVSVGEEPLEILLQNEFKEEDIDGYHCDACKNKCLAKKSVSIWRLPRLLIVTLKRFTPMGGRDNSQFNYDGGNIILESVFSPESQESTKSKPYKVFATVDHHGNHMGGHYTSQALSPVWKKWHLYDDETANEIKEPRFGVYTYMLFFRPA
jgi:ubiquitin C-terminal hydrolase